MVSHTIPSKSRFSKSGISYHQVRRRDVLSSLIILSDDEVAFLDVLLDSDGVLDRDGFEVGSL